jgi:hypothetical protein
VVSVELSSLLHFIINPNHQVRVDIFGDWDFDKFDKLIAIDHANALHKILSKWHNDVAICIDLPVIEANILSS